MATYPNNYRTGTGFNPNYSYGGITALHIYNANNGRGAGSRRAMFTASNISQFVSVPDGYALKTPFPPLKAGAMSSFINEIATFGTPSQPLIIGLPMVTSEQILAMSAEGSISVRVFMDGSATVASFSTPSSNLNIVVALSGDGAITFSTPSCLMSLLVPFDGSGAIATFTGLADLRGRMSMEGSFSPFTELSPENLARAVWESLTVDYAANGTMGEKLQDAYQAKVWMSDDNASLSDRYLVVWHRNGMPITTGITSPTIQIIQSSNGLNLLPVTAMTQIGATGTYKHEESTNRIANGAGYLIKVSATIDGSVRTWFQPVSRDS